MLYPFYLFEVAGMRYAADIQKARVATLTRAHWRVITNESVINRFAAAGVTVYGARDTRVHRLEVQNEWKLPPKTAGKTLSFVVNDARLYATTERRGMFHISLAEERDAVSRK